MWKDINGFEGIYQINEYGDVKNIKTDSIMHYYITNKGYKAIDLSKDGKKYKRLVHRLVAENFIPNPNNYPIVLHLDNDKMNDYYQNLKWGTYSENNSQAINDGLNILTLPDNTKYYELYNDSEVILCRGASEVMNLVGCSESVVRNLLFRKSKVTSGKYKGYKLRKSEKKTTKPIYRYKVFK